MERDYSTTPLAKKLGVAPAMTVAAIGAPPGAVAQLGSLPSGCRVVTRMSKDVDLILWWPTSRAELARRAPALASATGTAGLWILWAKRSSGVVSEVTEQAVRETGLLTGLVDNKVAAFDQTWSALRFVPRRRPS